MSMAKGSGAAAPDSDFHILWVNPTPTPNQRCTHKHTTNFRLCIRASQNLEAQDFSVRLWTNLYHKENNEGEWHVVPMQYLSVSVRSDSGWTDHLFGVDLFVTCVGRFGFNYRAQCKKLKKKEKSDSHGEIEVRTEQFKSPLTEWIQYPMQAQITRNIWMGNHAAALEAPTTGYDCLINTSDNAPVYVQQVNRPVILRKFPIASGVDNVISDKKLHMAVRWLCEASQRCDKLMVFSKYCCARAPSVLIAYIYARNPDLSFEEAVKFVETRSPVYYHKGLKSALERLYPRG